MQRHTWLEGAGPEADLAPRSRPVRTRPAAGSGPGRETGRGQTDGTNGWRPISVRGTGKTVSWVRGGSIAGGARGWGWQGGRTRGDIPSHAQPVCARLWLYTAQRAALRPSSLTCGGAQPPLGRRLSGRGMSSGHARPGADTRLCPLCVPLKVRSLTFLSTAMGWGWRAERPQSRVQPLPANTPPTESSSPILAGVAGPRTARLGPSPAPRPGSLSSRTNSTPRGNRCLLMRS